MKSENGWKTRRFKFTHNSCTENNQRIGKQKHFNRNKITQNSKKLPDGVIVSKEARQTICRASSVFVLYLTSCAVAHSNKSKRKTLAVNDIMSAIGEMEFDSFIQPLNEILQCKLR